MKVKFLLFGIFFVVSTIMISCEADSFISNEGKVESSTVKVEEVNLVNHLNTQRGAGVSYFYDIVRNKHWNLDVSRNAVALFHKGNSYVVMADLRNGAKFGMVFDYPVSGAGTGDAKFTKKSLSTWNSYGNFFAIANSCYFKTGASPTPLAFPLKQDGQMYSYGNGGSWSNKPSDNTDNNKEKAVLNIYSDYADILLIGKNNMDYSKMTTDKSYAGFARYEGNNKLGNVGRTFVGIKDLDGDGKCELLFMLVTTLKTHNQAKDILEDTFKCDDIITFDGGGSSQLICDGESKISSSRKIPVAMVIKESSK